MTETKEGEGDPLDKLPSRQIYKNLKEGRGKHMGTGCDSESSVQDVLEKLEAYVVDCDTLGNIKQALCYVRQMNNDNGKKKEKGNYCYALYYWVAEEIWKVHKSDTTGGSTKFSKAIGGYQTKIEEKENKYGCKPPVPSTDPEVREAMKKLFDFTVDKDFICKARMGSGASVPGTYDAHVEEVKKAYSTVRDICTQKAEENNWCEDFREWYTDYNSKVTLELNCEVDSAAAVQLDAEKDMREHGKVEYHGPGPSESELASASSSTSSSHQPFSFNKFFSDDKNIVTLSSVMAAGAIFPLIGSLLYKYTDIFDRIKNSLFGGSNRNRRRGRSTIGRQHFDDTFTDNDSSTLGDDGSTTLGGGGGDVSSTLDGSSTDVSTIYNDGRSRPSTGRGRTRTGTNNRRPGNIRYYAT
ncbi:KIR protein [Plasmodium knowlesi strain H]|uniref:KIR protein n=3 Tax=Plasmodium knowlesi TaxID=5850 RepID=A0A5K1VQU8_PLAKH|nr:KIR protein [Plasmodium knowlesi strain H]OTN65841.1 KIR protein [Plasmodium knowlesi]CAA9987953.1 KIR protein [Plasmodium knowlesi strain H]SBO22169.1 KIR protein [Plasmodium knowlesi strain H]SBO29189.1 KIR protein [Plasmodium knowlesi strain H]VVS77427.1 KIR protein [Plasmodium knowlesi strain H]|eukprot:XP_002258933.1 KIR protein [Plasmodium knowlesi strain H]